MSIHILVLNYNGLDLLKECLPSVAEAAQASPVPCRVSVLDNRSADASRAYVAEQLPGVGWIGAPENRILLSFNPVVDRLQEEAVLLLNNDIKADPGFIAPLWKALQDRPEAFFASPRHLDFEGRYNGGRNACGLHLSLPWAGPSYPGAEAAALRPGRTLFTGNGLFRRDLFVRMGGFSDLYAPMGWEDTDLCYRAWRQGHPGLYVPGSVIYHKSSASLKKAFSARDRETLGFRNGFLCFYSNVDSALAWAWMVLALPLTLLACLATGRLAQAAGFFASLPRLPKALLARRKRPKPVLSDFVVWRECRRDF